MFVRRGGFQTRPRPDLPKRAGLKPAFRRICRNGKVQTCPYRCSLQSQPRRRAPDPAGCVRTSDAACFTHHVLLGLFLPSTQCLIIAKRIIKWYVVRGPSIASVHMQFPTARAIVRGVYRHEVPFDRFVPCLRSSTPATFCAAQFNSAIETQVLRNSLRKTLLTITSRGKAPTSLTLKAAAFFSKMRRIFLARRPDPHKRSCRLTCAKH